MTKRSLGEVTLPLDAHTSATVMGQVPKEVLEAIAKAFELEKRDRAERADRKDTLPAPPPEVPCTLDSLPPPPPVPAITEYRYSYSDPVDARTRPAHLALPPSTPYLLIGPAAQRRAPVPPVTQLTAMPIPPVPSVAPRSTNTATARATAALLTAALFAAGSAIAFSAHVFFDLF